MMRMIGLAATLGFLALSTVGAVSEVVPTNLSTESIAGIIESLRNDLDDVRTTIGNLNEAPEASTFSIWDRDKYQDDLNEYLDDAFEIIVPGIYKQYREQLREVDDIIQSRKEEASELRIQLMAAPASDGNLSLLERARGLSYPDGSKESLQQEIISLDQIVRELESTRMGIISEFKYSLESEFGIKIETRQVEAALYQVNGGSMIDAAIAAQVILAIESQLSTIVQQNSEPNIQRQYYGVAAITRLFLVRMHERHLHRYQAEWYPALDSIQSENDLIMAEAMTTLNRAESQDQRSAVEANIRVLERIAQTVSEYREVLLNRESMTMTRLASATINAEVALNTLRTVESAVQLSFVIESSSSDFAALTAFTTPDLIPLDDENFDEFLDISRLIEGS